MKKESIDNKCLLKSPYGDKEQLTEDLTYNGHDYQSTEYFRSPDNQKLEPGVDFYG